MSLCAALPPQTSQFRLADQPSRTMLMATPKADGPGTYIHDDESNQARIRIREYPYLETEEEYISENWPWSIVFWMLSLSSGAHILV